MDSIVFNELRQDFLDMEEKLLGVKKTEYANDNDRLINFKEVAAWLGIKPEEYAIVLISKHTHSIHRAVKSGDIKWCWSSDIGEGLKQRIADARNYLLLLAAILDEKDKMSRSSIIIDSGHD